MTRVASAADRPRNTPVDHGDPNFSYRMILQLQFRPRERSNNTATRRPAALSNERTNERTYERKLRRRREETASSVQRWQPRILETAARSVGVRKLCSAASRSLSRWPCRHTAALYSTAVRAGLLVELNRYIFLIARLNGLYNLARHILFKASVKANILVGTLDYVQTTMPFAFTWRAIGKEGGQYGRGGAACKMLRTPALAMQIEI